MAANSTVSQMVRRQLQSEIPELCEIKSLQLAEERLQRRECTACVAIGVWQLAITFLEFLHRVEESFNFINGSL